MKILKTFGIGEIPTQDTATPSFPSQQTTILDLTNIRYPRNIVLTNGFVTIQRPGVVAGIALADLAAALITLEPSLTWAPIIVTQPASMNVNPDGSAAFTVVASSEVMADQTYQWQENGVNVTDAGVFSGSATATLNVSNGTGHNGSSFTCIVTNTAGSTTTSAAILTIPGGS